MPHGDNEYKSRREEPPRRKNSLKDDPHGVALGDTMKRRVSKNRDPSGRRSSKDEPQRRGSHKYRELPYKRYSSRDRYNYDSHESTDYDSSGRRRRSSRTHSSRDHHYHHDSLGSIDYRSTDDTSSRRRRNSRTHSSRTHSSKGVSSYRRDESRRRSSANNKPSRRRSSDADPNHPFRKEDFNGSSKRRSRINSSGTRHDDSENLNRHSRTESSRRQSSRNEDDFKKAIVESFTAVRENKNAISSFERDSKKKEDIHHYRSAHGENDDLKKLKSKSTLNTIPTDCSSSLEDTTLDSDSQERMLVAGAEVKKGDRTKPANLRKRQWCFVALVLATVGAAVGIVFFVDDGKTMNAALAIDTPAPTISMSPSLVPSISLAPSDVPSMLPSSTPTISDRPTISDKPTRLPSDQPTVSKVPSLRPTSSNAPSRTNTPTDVPAPSKEPSMVPSVSQNPTWTPISRSWDFKIRLQWQEDYFWQEERDERWWCMECVKCEEYGRGDWWEHGCESYGNGNNRNCQDGDSIWIRDCRDRGNRFNVLQIAESESFMLRLDNTGLCIERRNKHLMFRTCNENEIDQQFVPWSDWSKFELRPLEMKEWTEREADCASQLHHPKAKEVVGLRNCRLSRIYETRHWERYG